MVRLGHPLQRPAVSIAINELPAAERLWLLGDNGVPGRQDQLFRQPDDEDRTGASAQYTA